jgi:hypothetical protein
MPNFSYVEGAVELAKREGLHLVALSIDGKYAKQGSAVVTGPTGPEMTEKVWELFRQLADVETRMK